MRIPVQQQLLFWVMCYSQPQLFPLPLVTATATAAKWNYYDYGTASPNPKENGILEESLRKYWRSTHAFRSIPRGGGGGEDNEEDDPVIRNSDSRKQHRNSRKRGGGRDEEEDNVGNNSNPDGDEEEEEEDASSSGLSDESSWVTNAVEHGSSDDDGDGDGEDATASAISATTAVIVDHDVSRTADSLSLDEEDNKRRSSASNTAEIVREAIGEFVYLPPSVEKRRKWAKASEMAQVNLNVKKSGLDRRTLYRSLLLEILSVQSTHLSDGEDVDDDEILTGPVNGRKYLTPETLFRLKSAITMASSPQWREHAQLSDGSPQKCTHGISFFDAYGRHVSRSSSPLDDDASSDIDNDSSDEPKKLLATQSMQEIVALSLSHAYNCPFVIIDDNILSNIRRNVEEQLDENNSNMEDVVNNVDILKEIVGMSSSGNLKDFVMPNFNPLTKIDEEADSLNVDGLSKPIVIFLRVDGCGNLFKSQACVDILQENCMSENSTNLLVLGREPPFLPTSFSRTSTPTSDLSSGSMSPPRSQTQPHVTKLPVPQSIPGAEIPVGRNDPEGSKRFNIFLVRLPNDDEDNPDAPTKIMGILAPADAGNLFPQIVSSINPDMASLTEVSSESNTTLTSATVEVELADKDVSSKETSLSEGMQTVMDQLISKILAGGALGEGTADYVKDVLGNQMLRKGMAENLSRAAPAFLDPRCSGVMLSVYIPPLGQAKTPHNEERSGSNALEAQNASDNKKNWLNKILSSHREEILASSQKDEPNKSNSHRTQNIPSSKNLRNLQSLQAMCTFVPLTGPDDPVRLKAWSRWIKREHENLFRRRNKRALSSSLRSHKLKLSNMEDSLSQALSSQDLTVEMGTIVKHAIEIEASKEMVNIISTRGEVSSEMSSIFLISPSSIVSAINYLYPKASTSSSANKHYTKDDLMNMATDKHERALVNNIIFPERIGISYEQIGGLDSVKELLRQSITYPLRYPQLYSEGIARESVKGVLLFGPPGTGKTLLAKAVATEGGAIFLSVDPSSVENKWLGESEKNAKAVFTLARRLAPCVIFLDEVDSLLSSREHSDDSAHGTLTSVKTTMMSEWDGLNTNTAGNDDENHRVVVIGSTNRPFDLDEAVLRRFPRRILVDLPDLQTRKEILQVTLSENRIDPQVNFTSIAERLDGYTGSDIKEVCREAVVQISHERAKLLDMGGATALDMNTDLRPVNMEDFDLALTKLKRSVSERGRELSRVYEWNESYGEIKKKDKKAPQYMNMFL